MGISSENGIFCIGMERKPIIMNDGPKAKVRLVQSCSYSPDVFWPGRRWGFRKGRNVDAEVESGDLSQKLCCELPVAAAGFGLIMMPIK